jgi:REP element-mobilizing transposase RayT
MTWSHGMTILIGGTMQFEKGRFYHLFNRTNNHELLFPLKENYTYFLQKFETHLRLHCAVFAYCLMPTHFHFLVRIEGNDSLLISKNIAILLRSYTRAINKRFSRHGNLFQQNTKAKLIDDESYLLTLMNYIHQNPTRAGLTKRLADWEYSSYRAYAGMQNGTLSEKGLMMRYFKSSEEFVRYSEEVVESVRKEYWV